jgi:hypothetical protein
MPQRNQLSRQINSPSFIEKMCNTSNDADLAIELRELKEEVRQLKKLLDPSIIITGQEAISEFRKLLKSEING